eukprot:TRINITY_DN15346_c0_g1_i2.p1 TRINITY_DN15346_c0_g1~~TRINITY_DN15346_c0_g1_i2.p1  ORF type:complete len:278 (+),score=20.34 TRINITY_DN15346_c0_g1_i2:152-985(+)
MAIASTTKPVQQPLEVASRCNVKLRAKVAEQRSIGDQSTIGGGNKFYVAVLQLRVQVRAKISDACQVFMIQLYRSYFLSIDSIASGNTFQDLHSQHKSRCQNFVNAPAHQQLTISDRNFRVMTGSLCIQMILQLPSDCILLEGGHSRQIWHPRGSRLIVIIMYSIWAMYGRRRHSQTSGRFLGLKVSILSNASQACRLMACWPSPWSPQGARTDGHGCLHSGGSFCTNSRARTGSHGRSSSSSELPSTLRTFLMRSGTLDARNTGLRHTQRPRLLTI